MNEDRKVLVLGIDGMDPRITKRMLKTSVCQIFKSISIEGQQERTYVYWGRSPPSRPRVGRPCLQEPIQGHMALLAIGDNLQTVWMQWYIILILPNAVQRLCGMLL